MTVVLALSVLLNVLLILWLLVKREARHFMRVMRDDEDGPIAHPEFRRFITNRKKDVTGISGEGYVVEGCVFSDGYGVSHWLDLPPMNEPKTEVWHLPWWRRFGPDPFTKISGHNGATEVVWVD